MINGDEAISNKVAVVTGAASGIGQAQTRIFLQHGYRVIAIDKQAYQINEKDASEKLTVIQADLSMRTNITDILNTILASHNSLDVLCNTAGILDGYQTIEETSPELWHQVFACNIDSMFYLTKALLPLLLEGSPGVIINMASIAGMTAGGGGIAYTTVKHAVIGFTKQLAYDYASMGLRVNAIAPGAIKTPMNQADFDGDGQMAQWVAEQVPMKRWAQAQEVANLTYYLASDNSTYIQGAVIPIDGGWLIR